MERRQSSFPRQWLILDSRLGHQLWKTLRRLPAGSGVLILLHDLPQGRRARIMRQLRRNAAAKSFCVIDERNGARRVHDQHELRQALLARTPLILLSPIHVTRSHPERQPIPRMRAAAHARLARRRLIALGGMDERRFSRIKRLGFVGWAGIDAWLRLTKGARGGFDSARAQAPG